MIALRFQKLKTFGTVCKKWKLLTVTFWYPKFTCFISKHFLFYFNYCLAPLNYWPGYGSNVDVRGNVFMQNTCPYPQFATDLVGNVSALSTPLIITTLPPVGPLFVDTDGDGIPDAWELANGLNPNSAADSALDTDGDGLSNFNEYIGGTNPNLRTNLDAGNANALKVIWP